MTPPTPTKEGHMPFTIPSLNTPCFTYYKIFGDLSSPLPTVIVLHGGPGGGHDYLLPFAELWPRYKLPVVLYDQIGCGLSTHLPQTAGDEAFWQESLFVSELNNLIDGLGLRDGAGFHILGQSWGGMLGAAFAATQPPGLRRLVLASAIADMDSGYQSIWAWRQRLPEETRRKLEVAEEKNDFESPDYRDVVGSFIKEFMCHVDEAPPEMKPTHKNMTDDKTVYGTMYGPSSLTIRGSLRDWTCIPRLSQIMVPSLVYNGEYDTSSDVATVPFFERIPRVRWITFPNAAHMCHLDGEKTRQKVFKIVGDFLTQNINP